LGDLGFFGAGQRRGTHVSVPKIGSRAALLCFGGILGFYAELRREYIWRNLFLVVLGVLGGDPRGTIEEGGHLVFPFVFGGIFCVTGGFVDFTPYDVICELFGLIYPKRLG
jgi:hypothetical protein